MASIPITTPAEKADKNGLWLSQQYPPLVSLFERVEAKLQLLAQAEQITLAEAGAYAISGRGKRLRPALLLLAAEACGGANEAALDLAAAVELLHTASLVHDDVVDEAAWRRGKAAARICWGNKISVLLGDYLFCRALSHLFLTSGRESLQQLVEVARQMCQGQVAELTEMGPELGESRYWEIIADKTASVFRFCGEAGAQCAGAAPEIAARFAEFGENFGMAFQLADDIHDLIGSQAASGKPVNHDLRQQKITLPIIYTLSTLKGEAREAFRQTLISPRRSEEDLRQLAEAARNCGGIDYAGRICREYQQAARQALLATPLLPETGESARQTLLSLCDNAFPLPVMPA
jgi:octaprenyl-diphosphate synthase